MFRIFVSFSAAFTPRQETLPRSPPARRRIPADLLHRPASTLYGLDLRNLRRKRCKHASHAVRQRRQPSSLFLAIPSELQQGVLAAELFHTFPQLLTPFVLLTVLNAVVIYVQRFPGGPA